MIGRFLVPLAASQVTHFLVPGIDGVPQLVGRLVSFAIKLERRRRSDDASAADEMVQLMRSRVPVDTARLYNGIEWWREGDVIRVNASAQHVSKAGRVGADYAFMVEYGTQPGLRGVPITETYFTRQEWYDAHPDSLSHPGRQYRSGPLRRIHHPHPGTPAQPYFWNSVEEVMERRHLELLHADDDYGWAA